MAQVNKCTAWHVECIMPAIRVFVPPSLLDPLEDLEERLEFNFTISQIDALQTTLITLSPTFKLKK